MKICKDTNRTTKSKWVPGHLYTGRQHSVICVVVSFDGINKLVDLRSGLVWSTCSTTALDWDDVTEQYCLQKLS